MDPPSPANRGWDPHPHPRTNRGIGDGDGDGDRGFRALNGEVHVPLHSLVQWDFGTGARHSDTAGTVPSAAVTLPAGGLNAVPMLDDGD